MTRVAAVQTKRRSIDYKLAAPDALAHVERNLNELASLAERAATQGCEIIAFPEDTLGTLEWESGNWGQAPDVLAPAEPMMLERLGEIAKANGMNIICCNDCVGEGGIYNTAILLGRDGREIGRYRKVNLPIHEQS
ncbi:MAG TPA: carbon-nitrogen hydrolase family protein, partial [Armatimonadota bacterium]|nr:carbon-nitrogen hydrolase family protein [Armatimonadota bacterium]